MSNNVLSSIKSKITTRKKTTIIIAIAIITAIVLPNILYNILAPKIDEDLYNVAIMLYDTSYDASINQGDIAALAVSEEIGKAMLDGVKTQDEKIYVAAVCQSIEDMLNYGFNSAVQDELSESNTRYQQAEQEKIALKKKIVQMGKDLSKNNVWLVTKYAKELSDSYTFKDYKIFD